MPNAPIPSQPPVQRPLVLFILSLGLPLSFPAMRQPATLPAGTAWARPKQSPGVFAGRSGSRRWVRLYQDLCGRDARAPGWASSHDARISRSRYRRCIRAPLVIEGGPSLFVFIRVHWWFVFRNDRQFLPRMIRPVVGGRGPGLPETTPCAARRETRSKSSMVRRLIDMDGQDAQDYLARVSTVMSSTIASVPTRISPNPLPGSWITSNTHPIIERVCFLWRSLSCCLSCLSCVSMFNK